MNRMFALTVLAAAACLVPALAISTADAATLPIADTFDRGANGDQTRNTDNLGTMSDGTHTWSPRWDGSDRFQIRMIDIDNDGDNELRMNNKNSVNDQEPAVAVDNFTVADAIIEATVQEITSNTTGFTYRANSLDAAKDLNFSGGFDGYSARVAANWSGSDDVLLIQDSSSVLATADIASSRPAKTTLKVIFNGDRHQVFVDGTQVIDVTDSTITSAGHTGIANFFSRSVWDDYSVTVVPEPASLALLGLGGLMLIGRRQRKA